MRALSIYCLLAGMGAMASGADANPLLRESPLPYKLPPFAQIKDEHFAPAFDQGMREELAEVAKIANNKAKPTFENTIVALERTGRLLDRARGAFGILTASLTNPALQKLDAEYSPKFAQQRDAISLNPALFRRVQDVYDRRDKLKLDAESKRLVERTHEQFVRAGAKLAPAEQTRLKAINAELARLTTKFRQNVLAEVNASSVIVEKRADLAGWSDAAIAASATKDGKYAIRLTNTTGQPPLDSLENPAVRRRVMDASLARGTRGNDWDNRAIVTAIARNRAEFAKLLGYPSFAAYNLAIQTAGTVEAVNALLARIAPAAVANARKEAADMAALAGKAGVELSAADWSHFAEKVRREKYAFDNAELRPYYEMRRVLVDGVFFAATKLYGITFRERTDLKGYSPDMVVFEVFNEDGSALGLFLLDIYARPNKRGGAWANSYVPRNALTGEKPVIGNHLNVPKPPAGEPTLLTHSEVNTLFHEFGHALHGLFNAVKYPRLSPVPRDFVEFPSQVNEMWATWPEIFGNYAKHYQTGAPMPKELLDKVKRADKFNQGFATTEMAGATILDQAWHQIGVNEIPDDAVAFEAAVLEKHGLDFPLVPPRYRSTYFSHVFSGGYAAGYYSYLWSEVLDADTVEWFKQNGGLKRENGDRFRRMLLSRGSSIDPKEMYRAFRGADPDTTHLLRRRALLE